MMRDQRLPVARYHSCGTVNAMRTTIDRAGRVVIPRQLRERIGLANGGEVDVELDGAGIRIEAISGQGLEEEDGRLVIPATGQTLDVDDVREMIDADRHRH